LRMLHRHDRATFHECLALVRRLVPGYAPRKPSYLWLMSKFVGYERAEAVIEMARPVRERLRRV
jgi:hypothetical protein